MNEEKRTSWVVYLMSAKSHPEGMRAVCEQSEWDAMQQDQSCQRTLIRAGITNEGEAERLARGASGAARVRNSKARMTAWPGEAAAAPVEAEAAVAG